jgi:UDP-3-O-[3-hydroxymyristoyl] glucosamine N-acyltransferase LpxD
VLRATLHETEIRRAIGISGEGNRVVHGVATLGMKENECLYFASKPITNAIRDSFADRRGCILIVPTGSAGDDLGECVILETHNPRAAIANVLRFIAVERRQSPWLSERKMGQRTAISPLAVVDEHVAIGDEVVIEPFCVIDADVSIGAGSILRSGVHVYPRVAIAHESLIGSNTVIGHQGYGFVRDEFGYKTRIPHLGGVKIGSHVEIGALATVPSGTIGPTVIEDHAKIDDHVHVGHNVHVAKSASVTAGVIIGGSATIAEEAWVGVNSSIRDGRRVGAHCLVGMDVSLQQDLADNSVVRSPRPDVQIRDQDDRTAIGFQNYEKNG